MLKRLLDIVIASSALVLLSPVYAFVAYKVRKKLGSPVLFRQVRPGLNGKLFEIPPRTALQTADQTLGFKRFGGGFQLGHQGIIAVERPLGEREEKARIAPQPCIAGRGCRAAMPHIQQVARQLQAVIRKAKGLIQIPQTRHQHAAVFEHQQRQQGCSQPQCQPPAAAGRFWLRMLRGRPHHCRCKAYRKKRADINGNAEHCVGFQNQLPAGRLGHAVPQAGKQQQEQTIYFSFSLRTIFFT